MTDRDRPMTRRKPKRKKQNAAAGSRLAALEAEVQDLREQLALERLHFDGALDAVAEARRELGSAREHYVDLYDTAPVGYVLLDRNGFIQHANLTAARLLGVPRERLSHTLLAWFVVKADHRTVLQHLQRCRRSAGDDEVTSEVKLAGADGRLLDIVLTSRTQPPPSKVPAEIGFRTALVDITERKQAEQKVRESEERLRILINGARDYAVLMLNTEGQVASWNEGAVRMLGYRTEEILGTSHEVFYSQEAIAAGQPARDLQRRRRRTAVTSKINGVRAKTVPSLWPIPSSRRCGTKINRYVGSPS